MSPQDSSSHLNTYIEMLRDIINRLIQKNAKIQFSKDPVIEKRDIVEYNKKMRVSALEKFNAPGYLSAINYYLSPKDKETKNAAGAFIFYIVEGNLKKSFEAAGMAVAGFDDDDLEQVTAKCNQLCQAISDEFCSELKNKGYKELIPSAPVSARNTISEGVDFSFNQYQKCEVSFHVKSIKSFTLEVTLPSLKK